MRAQQEFEEELIRREREKSAAERRRRNAVAIDEVVGREPARNLGTPADLFKRLPDRDLSKN